MALPSAVGGRKLDTIKPEHVEQGLNWWAQAGAFIGGIVTILATRIGLRSKGQRTEIEELVRSIREDGDKTREILEAMRTDLAVLLDRDRRK